MYLSIPEVTESEEISSLSSDADGKTFHVTTGMTAVTTRLFQIAAQGEVLPLVVIATDGVFYALDNAVITAATTGGASPEPTASFSFNAEAVRFS